MIWYWVAGWVMGILPACAFTIGYYDTINYYNSPKEGLLTIILWPISLSMLIAYRIGKFVGFLVNVLNKEGM